MANLVKALDAAYPPPPAQWVAAMNAAGAEVGFVYVWPWKTYTEEHVVAALNAGKRVIPIVVPGVSPPPPPLYAAAWPYGIRSGAIIYDVARGDGQPATGWVTQAEQECVANGWQPITYTQPSDEGQFPSRLYFIAAPGPEPTSLPANVVAAQYAFDVAIEGHTYDISVVDLDKVQTISAAPAAPTPPPAPAPTPTPTPTPPPVQPPSSVGQQISLTTPHTGFYTAAEAAAGRSNGQPTGVVPAGTYYVFNEAQGMFNVTRVRGVPGSWINPGQEVPVAPPSAPPPPAGAVYAVTHWQPGYITAADAEHRRAVRAQVPPGNYHVFNRVNGMVALSHLAAPGVALFWINPAQ